MVNGHNGNADVIEQNGRLFVDVSALAIIGKASVSFSGPRIVLTFPSAASATATAGTAAPPVATSPPASSSALFQEFMKAGIEEIAGLPEWATTLASAIRGKLCVGTISDCDTPATRLQPDGFSVLFGAFPTCS